MKLNSLIITVALARLLSLPVMAQYAAWTNSGVINIITTADGANIPAAGDEDNFPLLVRLNTGFFNFSQAKAGGADIRFSSGTTPLKYQIEEWDAAGGSASIWVLIPNIKGNAVQPINIHWGNAAATSESSGSAVFNSTSSFLSVFHLDNATTDEVGTLTAQDLGSTAASGMIGAARHFSGAGGITGGENITNYPTGSSPHTTSAWFRAENTSSRIIAWGLEQGQGKVQLWVNGPPHIRLDGYFSNASLTGTNVFNLNEWVHVSFSYESGNANLYINGVLNQSNTSSSGPLDLQSPQRFYIGGWYNSYNYIGDVDEVRISNVNRSANWVKMEFENQKPLQTLAGWIVPAGTDFSVSQASVTVAEGGSAPITAQAGGALKTVWTLIDGTQQSVFAANTLAVNFPGIRVTGNKQVTLRFSAVYPTEVKTSDIAITITEALPEPVFTLTAPPTWNGRDPINVTANISNQAAMQTAGVGTLDYSWDVSGMAVIKSENGGTLSLTRGSNTGKLFAQLTIGNGGAGITRLAVINVTEPATDPWVLRTPGANEKPEAGQFFARADISGKCTIHYNGTQNGATSVYLKALEGNTEVDKTTVNTTGGVYQLSVEVDARLAHYSVEFGTADGGETSVATVGNLLCGDAYIIQGQSNAEAMDGITHPYGSQYIRSYGHGEQGNNATLARTEQWGDAVSTDGNRLLHIGYWAMEMAKDLLAEYQVPLFIINGAKGGTITSQHQKNYADPTDVTTIYGRLLWRIQQAKLTHGIRGVLWHQGENSQGSVPSGHYGYQVYHEEWTQLAADWKTDFPNIKHYHLFQIRPSCGGGGEPANMLREVQRTLPDLFSNAHIMTTVGIQPPGGCHYPAEGYVVMANLIYPLVARDHYGKVYTTSITPPAIQRAYYNGAAKTTITMEFDQPVVWESVLEKHWFLDGAAMNIASAATTGNNLTITLSAASTAETIGYLDKDGFGQNDPVLDGTNGIAALTFWNYPIYPDENYVPTSVDKQNARPGVPPITGITGNLKNGTLQINFTQMDNEPLVVQMYNFKSVAVFEHRFLASGSSSVQFNVPELNQGVYVLRVTRRSGTVWLKKITSF